MSEKLQYWKLPTEELQRICTELNIPFDGKSRKEAIAKIQAARGEIVEPKDEKKGMRKEDFVVVIFHNKDEQDLPFVFVGLNGKSWYLPKEKEILIPKVLLGVINDAVETKFVQKKAPDGRPYLEERKVHRFPYTIVNTK